MPLGILQELKNTKRQTPSPHLMILMKSHKEMSPLSEAKTPLSFLLVLLVEKKSHTNWNFKKMLFLLLLSIYV